MKSQIERFWNKVDKTPSEEGCWLWTGSLCTAGQGQFHWDGRLTLVHRISWEIVNGPVPPGWLVLHKTGCPNKNCCKPEHLYIGSHQDNQLDRYQHIRKRAHHIGPRKITPRPKTPELIKNENSRTIPIEH